MTRKIVVITGRAQEFCLELKFKSRLEVGLGS